jgi:hypothetical protein
MVSKYLLSKKSSFLDFFYVRQIYVMCELEMNGR